MGCIKFKMDVSGKVAVVTGGAEGIGKAIVEALLKRNTKGVVIADINNDKGKQTEAEFQKSFGVDRVIFRQCDVTNKEHVKDTFLTTKVTFGQLNIICNNAGILDEIDWEKMLRINLHGVITGTQLGIEHLDSSEQNPDGVIINIASETAIRFYTRVPIYSTSKVAVLSYTRHMALFDSEVKRKHIRLNTVCPSLTETMLRATGRIIMKPGESLPEFEVPLQPSDIAKCVLQLIEEDHNGQSMYLPSDGEPYLLKDEQLVATEVFRHKFKGAPDAATP